MKKYAIAFFTFFLVLLSTNCIAQDTQWKPVLRGQTVKGQSLRGHWVIEHHKQSPDRQLITFYTKDNIVMYQEEVSASKVRYDKPKTIKKIEKLLVEIALEWEQSKAIVSQQLVANSFN